MKSHYGHCLMTCRDHTLFNNCLFPSSTDPTLGPLLLFAAFTNNRVVNLNSKRWNLKRLTSVSFLSLSAGGSSNYKTEHRQRGMSRCISELSLGFWRLEDLWAKSVLSSKINRLGCSWGWGLMAQLSSRDMLGRIQYCRPFCKQSSWLQGSVLWS